MRLVLAADQKTNAHCTRKLNVDFCHLTINGTPRAYADSSEFSFPVN